MLAMISSFFYQIPMTQAAVYKKGFTFQKLPARIKKKITGVSYRKNRYISYDDLRYVRVRYYNFSGKVKSGELIVNKKIAKKTVKIFYELYRIKYPMTKRRCALIIPLLLIFGRLLEPIDCQNMRLVLRSILIRASIRILTAKEF